MYGFRKLSSIKNYYFDNELAYTEDSILVYNLFVFQIPKFVTRKNLFDYFGHYGRVLKVNMSNRTVNKRNTNRTAFIYFVEAEAAAQALYDGYNHTINKACVRVKACDSWIQPRIKIANVGDHNEGAKQESRDPSQTMLKLNDDCLELICKELDLLDQLNFSRVCRRFANIFAIQCKLKYKILHLEQLERLTLWNKRDLLRSAGPFVEKIQGLFGKRDRERIFEFIGNYCTNLKSIDLAEIDLSINLLYKLLVKLKDLCEINVGGSSINDNSIYALRNMHNLEKLSLYDNHKITGKNLHFLKNLKILNLYNCCNVQSNNLLKAFKSLKKLKQLDIRINYHLPEELFTGMVAHLANLEILKITYTFGKDNRIIAQLPNLKELNIQSKLVFEPIGCELFEDLIKTKSQQLEMLRISSPNSITLAEATLISQLTKLKRLYCPHNSRIDDECLEKFSKLVCLEELSIANCNAITDDGLLSVLRGCEKLRHVDVRHCTKITDDFIYKTARDIMPKRNAKQKRSTIFYVNGTKINSIILDEVCVKDAPLRLIFYVYNTFTKNDPDQADINKFLEDRDNKDGNNSFDIENDMSIPPLLVLDGLEEYYDSEDYDFDDDNLDDEDFMDHLYMLGPYDGYLDVDRFMW